MMKISQQEVEIYRDIYYEHEKPMLISEMTQEEIAEALLPIVVLKGWTMEKYHAFKSLDLMQRIAYLNATTKLQGKKPNLFMKAGNDLLQCENAYNGIPELRCPLRSEEQRNLN
jgi:hypothetical protein